MIISEKQIMQLINNTHHLISRMCRENSPTEQILQQANLLDEIANQQSDELKEIE